MNSCLLKLVCCEMQQEAENSVLPPTSPTVLKWLWNVTPQFGLFLANIDIMIAASGTALIIIKYRGCFTHLIINTIHHHVLHDF